MHQLTIDIELEGNKYTLNHKDITDLFHHIYYGSRVWTDTYWLGNQILKCPLDMWIYQEILWDIKPDYLIETGTYHGGSALYYANLFDLIGNGKVITIDVQTRSPQPKHPRIEYVVGSSIDPEIFKKLQKKTSGSKSTMVVLDSDHSMDHVYKEMLIYSDLVTPGNYLIVEDSNINGHPVRSDFGPGPMEAINEFLKNTSKFTIDISKQKFFMTQNPRGYLQKNI